MAVEKCVLQAGNFGKEKVIIFGDSCPFQRRQIDSCDQTDTQLTFSPTISPKACSNGKSWVEVSITTDEFPYETSWDVQVYEEDEILLATDDYNLQDHRYHDAICLSLDSTCYWFHMRDYAGDGLRPGAGYALKVDGVTRVSGGGDFGAEKTYKIGECPVCDNKYDEVKIELITDNNGSDVSWTLERWSASSKSFVTYLTGGVDKPFASNTNTTVSHCVAPKGCHRLTLKDKGGDGLCCDDGEGYFRLSFQGTRTIDKVT